MKNDTINNLLFFLIGATVAFSASALIVKYQYQKDIKDYQIDIKFGSMDIYDGSRHVGKIQYQNTALDSLILNDNK